jgi:hypothetical protein
MRLPLPQGTRARRWLLALYAISAVLVTVREGILAPSNNFKVFRWASVNLLAGRDLYAAHPEQYFDNYKYSPAFALLFTPFAQLPFALAFLGWSLLNALLLWYAVERLLPQRQATLTLGLLYLEVLFAMQYGQSNALVAALMILAFLAFERDRPLEAATEIAVGASIKLFPLALLPVAVCYPRRARFAVAFLAVTAALVVLPLLAVPAHELVAQYRAWQAIEAADTLNRGYSLMEYLALWFRVDWPNWPVQLAGTALLVAPLALGRARWSDAAFRRLFLCSVLVYVVLFNHQSERATFVIAYTGIVVWYVSSAPNRLTAAILVFTLLVMIVHDVDIVPRWVKAEILIPYRIKGIPCVVAWFAMQAELLATALRSESAGNPLAGTAPEPRGA